MNVTAFLPAPRRNETLKTSSFSVSLLSSISMATESSLCADRSVPLTSFSAVSLLLLLLLLVVVIVVVVVVV